MALWRISLMSVNPALNDFMGKRKKCFPVPKIVFKFFWQKLLVFLAFNYLLSIYLPTATRSKSYGLQLANRKRFGQSHISLFSSALTGVESWRVSVQFTPLPLLIISFSLTCCILCSFL